MTTQVEANYREGSETARCALCANFVEPDKCKLVEGKINPEGLCDLFEAPEEAAPSVPLEQLEQDLFMGPGVE